MIKLSREIRFSLSGEWDSASRNSWAGWPSAHHLSPWLVLRAITEGQPDEETGFLCNVKRIDDVLRSVVKETVNPSQNMTFSAEDFLRVAFSQLSTQWQLEARLLALELQISPYLRYSIHSREKSMIHLTHQFEFSASHRLHCDHFSDEQNREIFGKCNNPNGHGHNYVVDISLQREIVNTVDSGQVARLPEMEDTVNRLVIDRLDHKHLNQDVHYFQKVNPSVENIAIAIWHWLEGQFGEATLSAVKVYETPKTWAEYRGP